MLLSIVTQKKALEKLSPVLAKIYEHDRWDDVKKVLIETHGHIYQNEYHPRCFGFTDKKTAKEKIVYLKSKGYKIVRIGNLNTEKPIHIEAFIEPVNIKLKTVQVFQTLPYKLQTFVLNAIEDEMNAFKAILEGSINGKQKALDQIRLNFASDAYQYLRLFMRQLL